MPSWNIHTAHVESLLASHRPEDLGIEDANAFLFGNYAPDVYVGFMVPDAAFRVDYCMTHVAKPNMVPIPNADFFWNHYVARRMPETKAGRGLLLGAWAHLVADRYYNGNFRTFWLTHDVPTSEIMRKGKQGDFDLFGHSLHIATYVEENAELIQAAKEFAPYSILPDDVAKAIKVANDIVDSGGRVPDDHGYLLLSSDWMKGVFAAYEERIVTWLKAWCELESAGCDCSAESIRAHAGLPDAMPDDPGWQQAKSSA